MYGSLEIDLPVEFGQWKPLERAWRQEAELRVCSIVLPRTLCEGSEQCVSKLEVWPPDSLRIPHKPCVCMCTHACAQSCPTLCSPRTVAYRASLSMGFSRQEYWRGLLFPSPPHKPDSLAFWDCPLLTVWHRHGASDCDARLASVLCGFPAVCPHRVKQRLYQIFLKWSYLEHSTWFFLGS